MGSIALQRRAARLEAVKDIQRLMSMHCYLTAAGRHEELMLLFAQRRPEVSAELADWGVFTGLDRVRDVLVTPLARMAEANGVGVRQNHPDVADDRAGMLLENALMTPLIRVSADATEAKGLWQVLGAAAGFDPGVGRVTPTWSWVTFAVDFVTEDGEWKILRFRVAPRFRTLFDQSWVETALEGPVKPPPGVVPEPDLPPSYATPTDYSLDRAALLDPPIPAAYPLADADREPVDPADLALAARLQRLEDTHEISNLMAVHEYLHTANRNDEEFANHFAKAAPGLAFEPEDWGVWEGTAAVEACYVDAAPPALPGLVTEHAATTPVIEVSGDGQTAKGVWISPGHETFPRPGGSPLAHWSWGRYGIDFVKEDGVWKFWHFHIYTTFRTPYHVSWVEAAVDPSRRIFEEGQLPPGMPTPTRAGTFNQEYHPHLSPALQPPPPEPYRTFTDTFSYIPTSA